MVEEESALIMMGFVGTEVVSGANMRDNMNEIRRFIPQSKMKKEKPKIPAMGPHFEPMEPLHQQIRQSCSLDFTSIISLITQYGVLFIIVVSIYDR